MKAKGNTTNEYKKGYEKGRKDEAENTLYNLYRILDDMTEEPHETSHIMSCIRDLEKDLKMSRKDFDF